MNKILLSFSAFSCFIVTCAFYAFLNSRCSSVLGHSTLWNLKHCKWSFVLLHKKPCLHYLQFMLFSIFNWRKFIQISFKFKHKLEFLMNSSVQISQIKLEFLRNSSFIFKSSYQRCSIQKTVLKKFVIFTEKQLWWSLFFNKAADLWACNFTENWLQHRCFPVSKIFKNTYFKENDHFWIFENCFLRTYLGQAIPLKQ